MRAPVAHAPSAESAPPTVAAPAADWETPFTVRGRLAEPLAVSWRVEPGDDHDALQAATEAATRAWNAAAACVAFRPARDGETATVVLAWRGADDDPCHLFGHGLSVAHSGPMEDPTFMHVDRDHPWGDRAAEPCGALATAVAHELGHVLGLDHSPDSSALMYPDTRAPGPGPADLDGVLSLYGGGEDAPGDVVIESDDGRRCAPALRGVAPPERTALTLLDVDGDGGDELLVWRTDAAGFGAATIYEFEVGPRLVRTRGPMLDLLPLGAASFLRRSPDGRRWILSRQLEFVRIYGFDPDGWPRVPDPQEQLALDLDALMAGPAPDILASEGVPAIPAQDNLTDGRRVTLLVGDLDGDGRLEHVRRVKTEGR